MSVGFTYSEVEDESTWNDGTVVRTRTVKTGPGSWEFSDPAFGNALGPHFTGRPLMIHAIRTAGAASDVREISIRAISGRPDEYYVIYLTSPSELPIDLRGFPVIERTMRLSGRLQIDHFRFGGYGHASGAADAQIDYLGKVPVEIKSVPPVVARPILTPEVLRAAPATLEFGSKRIAFGSATAYRPTLAEGLIVGLRIWEENVRDILEARLDFVWVVHESGVWEPEMSFHRYNNTFPTWDTPNIEGDGSDGPPWPVDTDVDIVVGFVDVNGDVSLMRTTRTIVLSF